MATDIVALNRVNLKRQGRLILRDVCWQIIPHEHWALIGANGSGKTTLLKVIAGYEWPTSGCVSVMGRRYGECNLPRLRRLIGWVSSALTDHVPGEDSALEVVASGLDSSFGLFRPFNDDEKKLARSALHRVGASNIADQPYGVLSQGERQRTLIARALIGRPQLLILDEPCAGLDPAARDHFLDDLGRLAREPDAPTIVLVTHHIEEIGPWITHALLLKDGGVLAAGAKADVLTSELLSRTFNRTCMVERRSSTYILTIPHFEKSLPGVEDLAHIHLHTDLSKPGPGE